MRRLTALVLLCACAPETGDPGPAFIAPLDGQTGVPEDLDLMIATGGLDLPADYPVAQEALRVVDLEAGGFVKGELRRESADLLFRPDGGWKAGHRYTWTLADVPAGPRQPQHELPPEILGEASFQAVDGTAVLDAGIGNLGAICLLLSRAVDEMPADLALTLNDEAVDGTWEIRPEWAPGRRIRLLQEDPGVNLACLLDPPALTGGESVRVWWGDDGPWHFTLDFVDAEALSKEERRRAW